MLRFGLETAVQFIRFGGLRSNEFELQSRQPLAEYHQLGVALEQDVVRRVTSRRDELPLCVTLCIRGRRGRTESSDSLLLTSHNTAALTADLRGERTSGSGSTLQGQVPIT